MAGQWVYDNISTAHRQTVDQLLKWGAHPTQAQLSRIEKAFQNIQAHATDSDAWISVQNAHVVTAQVARETIPHLTQAQLNQLEIGFQAISSWMPGEENFLKSVVEAPIDLAASAADAITTVAGGIPLIGPALHGVLIIASGPFTFTQQVAHGANIGDAVINDLKTKIQGVQEVAPYAQTVISFVPGIGQGVSAAISAGLALAQGQPIDKAILAGVRGAIPGGPAATAAFDLTVAAASGDNLVAAAGSAAIRNLGLPPAAEQGISSAFNVVYKAAKGENIPLAVLNQAREYMPDETSRKAFDIGLAVAQGKRLQDVALKEVANLVPAQIAQIKSVVPTLVQASPALGVVRNVLSNPAVQSGYDLGMSLIHHSGANDEILKTVRAKLPPEGQRGFDIGTTAYRIMKNQNTDLPRSIRDSNTAAGYAIAKSIENRSFAEQKKVLSQVANPQVRAGITYRQKEVESKRGFFSWLWHLIAG